MNQFIAAFFPAYKAYLRAADAEALGKEGNAGGIGSAIDRRRCQTDAELIPMHALEAILASARLYPEAKQHAVTGCPTPAF